MAPEAVVAPSHVGQGEARVDADLDREDAVPALGDAAQVRGQGDADGRRHLADDARMDAGPDRVVDAFRRQPGDNAVGNGLGR